MNKPVLQDKDLDIIFQSDPTKFIDALASNYFHQNQAERALGGYKHRELFKQWLRCYADKLVEDINADFVAWHGTAMQSSTQEADRIGRHHALCNLPLRKLGKLHIVDLGKVTKLINELEAKRDNT